MVNLSNFYFELWTDFFRGHKDRRTRNALREVNIHIAFNCLLGSLVNKPPEAKNDIEFTYMKTV